MRLAVIPARGGSKRIPRKNIKLFNDLPIIAYSIRAALASGCFDEVIVSTDDEEIASVAREYGASVPFFRPAELSGDFVPTIPVVKHAIEWFEEQQVFFDEVCCIYATAPFLQPNSLKAALETLLAGNINYCFSGTAYSFPIQRAVKLNEKGRVEMFFPEHFLTRSQDLEESYHDAGQFYWGLVNAWKQAQPIFSSESELYRLPGYLVQDIDTPEDWVRTELMHKVLSQQGIL